MVFCGGLKDSKQFLCGKNSGREEVVDSLLLLVTAHSTLILSFPVYQLQSSKKETKVFEMKPLDFTAVLRSQSSHTQVFWKLELLQKAEPGLNQQINHKISARPQMLTQSAREAIGKRP